MFKGKNLHLQKEKDLKTKIEYNRKKYREDPIYRQKKSLKAKIKNKIYSKTLDDNYIKSLLTNNGSGLLVPDLTPELIELKRKELKLKRNVKENANSNSK